MIWYSMLYRKFYFIKRLYLKTLVPIIKNLAKDKIILLVEDDKTILQNLHGILGTFFFASYTASDYEQALEIYNELSMKSEIPIFVVTDINIGNKNGIDLTNALRAINPGQRVLAISGVEESKIFIESIKCGIDRFVLKPIELNGLFSSVVAVLTKIDYDLELIQSKRALEKSKEYTVKLLKEQDEFLKNAIHEIHTPLAVIITNVDLLRMQGIENKSLNAIEAGVRIIQNSYEDMTYLMKKDRMADSKKNINLVDFIKERVNYFTCIADVNELCFSIVIGQLNIPDIHISELKLLRLVDNNLSNAIKYSHKPNKISITIGINKDNIFFEVKNIGPIIVDKEKIFDRFYRENDQKSGYGLGLNIVNQICKEENIEIKISSSSSRGTAFRYIFKSSNICNILSV